MLAALGLPAPASAEAIVARVGPKVVSYQSYRHWLHVGESAAASAARTRASRLCSF